MSKHQMNYTKICSLPSPIIDGVIYRGMSSFTKDGTTLYSLKFGDVGNDKTKFIIYKTTNFPTKPKTTLLKITKNGKEVSKTYKHPNSITFAKKPNATSGHLFIATMNESADECQAIMLTTSGEIKKELLYDKKGKNVKLMCIDYIGVDDDNNYQFVVGLVNRKDKKCRYDIVTLKDNKLVYAGRTFYSQPVYYPSNDILYVPSKKRFYNTFYTFTDDGKLGINYIYVYNINIDPSKIKNGQQFNPIETIVVKLTSEYQCFEVESIIQIGSALYIVANAGIRSSYDGDGIYRLK